MGMAAILFSSTKLFDKLLILLDRRLHVKSGENWQVVLQKTFKDSYDFIHTQSLRARADTLSELNLDCLLTSFTT